MSGIVAPVVYGLFRDCENLIPGTDGTFTISDRAICRHCHNHGRVLLDGRHGPRAADGLPMYDLGAVPCPMCALGGVIAGERHFWQGVNPDSARWRWESGLSFRHVFACSTDGCQRPTVRLGVTCDRCEASGAAPRPKGVAGIVATAAAAAKSRRQSSKSPVAGLSKQQRLERLKRATGVDAPIPFADDTEPASSIPQHNERESA